MNEVYVIHNIDIITPLAAVASFVWGWILTGGMIRLSYRAADVVAVYFLQRFLDSRFPHWTTYPKHFLENHKGLKPRVCSVGKCQQLS